MALEFKRELLQAFIAFEITHLRKDVTKLANLFSMEIWKTGKNINLAILLILLFSKNVPDYSCYTVLEKTQERLLRIQLIDLNDEQNNKKKQLLIYKGVLSCLVK